MTEAKPNYAQRYYRRNKDKVRAYQKRHKKRIQAYQRDYYWRVTVPRRNAAKTGHRRPGRPRKAT